MQFQRRHRPQQLPALADIGGGFHQPATLLERALQVAEEIVLERLRGQDGHREAAAVVVERGVDNEPRAVAGFLPRADVLDSGGAVEPLPEDLGEGLGGQGGVDPAKGE